ncbi:NAD-dependent epimerase/dehydratase family protein [Actinopolymorpha alba]|uniref:NAD-dependent epimerase/dehydratase family protein n=1 Tax=Actinopolymorpha alba TaxID=533267 RepID=UPI000365837B|nr:NAD-dependent epimerase/dehydratase family protein [Actinopolymorpha alba]
MRILVLGGTIFLSKAVAAEAVARGHEVTCAARGSSGEPPAGASFVRVDRDDPEGLTALAGQSFDAVFDVARQPTQVRRALAAFAAGSVHWTFVSTMNVYADDSTPGQHGDTAILREALPADADEDDAENYGAAKVACENAVADAVGDRAFVVRAGLIVGPGDPSDRFTYWPVRLARGGEVAAPGAPEDSVQFVDVRDLANWIVDAAETRLTGTYDATYPPRSRGEILTRIGAAVGGQQPALTWVDQEFLTAEKVNPWSGPRSVPLWLPLPEYAGFMTRDVSPAQAAGLSARPLEETARDTLAWVRSSGRDALRCGLTAAEETELLAAWHRRDPARG